MLNILLFVHIVVSLLLIIVILLQRTGTDGLGSIGGGGNMGIVTGRAAANFLTKTTIVLGTIFIINSIILANLSSQKNTKNISDKIENIEHGKETSLPVK